VGSPPGSILNNKNPPAKFWNHEARRAFIGTYVLSTFCSHLYRKQSPLIHTQYLEDCALSLCEDNCNSSDIRLIHYARLLRIASDVFNTLHHEGQDDEQEMGDDKVYAIVIALERQLVEWRSNLPIALSEDVMLKAGSNLIDAYIHEVGLYSALQGQFLSVTRIEILYRCLNAVQNYVSNITPLSIELMEGWTGFDWRQLNYLTMLATKIVLTIDSTTGTEDSAARVSKLDAFLDDLSVKLRSLYSMTNTPDGQYHYFQQLSVEWQNMKSLLRINRDRSSLLANQGNGMRPHDGSVIRNQANQGIDIAQVQGLNWTAFGATDNWADSDFWSRPVWGLESFTGPSFQ